jgi:hypothetical protein
VALGLAVCPLRGARGAAVSLVAAGLAGGAVTAGASLLRLIRTA